MNRTFVGLHIPKCAGTSFLEMVSEALPAHELFQNTSIIRNWQNQRPEFLDIIDYAALRVVWGHSIHEQMLYRLTNPVLFTGLREPVERLISHARYEVDLAQQQNRDHNLAQWLPDQRNPMCWFLIHRFPTLAERDNPALTPFQRARRVLRNFHYVYLTDTFEASVAKIFDELGVEFQEKKSNVGVNPDLDIEINLNNLKHDIDLYHWAQDRFGDREFDFDRPMLPALQQFMAAEPQPDVLAEFLLEAQAGEYRDWSALDEVIEKKVIQATRLLKEAEYYRNNKRR